MGILQSGLQAEIRRIPVNVIAGLLKCKLQAADVDLSEKEQRRLLRQILSGRRIIRLRSSAQSEKRDITLEFTAADLAKLDATTQRVLDHLPETLNTVLAATVPALIKDLKRRWPKEWRGQIREYNGFSKRLEERWGCALGLLRMLLTIAREYGGDVAAEVRGTEAASKTPHLVEVLPRLHARACQIAHEIITLLTSGFADGAMARWRTLHEVAVVALFISERGEATAERYALHRYVESHLGASGYQQYCDRLGAKPLSDGVLNEIERSYTFVMSRFGENFGSQYGWAAEDLSVRRPTFAHIEQAVAVEHLRPYYRLASHNVHANPKGVFFKLGLLDEADLLLAGGSNAGLADPGSNTAVSLVQACSSLMRLQPSFDGMAAIRTLLALGEETGLAFQSAHEKLLNEVKEIDSEDGLDLPKS